MNYLSTLLVLATAGSFANGLVATGTTGSKLASRTNTAPRQESSCSEDRTKFEYFGVNESGAEFGNQNIPGTLGTDYIWPAASSIDYFVDLGFNFFRVPFQAERLAPPATGLAGAFDETYLSDLKETVEYITGKGASVAIEPHNFMIYDGSTISSNEDFAAFWTNLANEFSDNSDVIFDLMNEPHDIDAQVVYEAMQAAVDAIRETGATQLILVEGTSWTGAWTWESSGNAAAFAALTDPGDNIAIEMHQYLDSDGSGTDPTCVSSTIGEERVSDATQWLLDNNFKGFLGEIGVGSNDDCIAALYGALCFMQESGAWIGAAYWAAGPWWGDYYQSIEPPSGGSVSRVLPEGLEPFL